MPRKFQLTWHAPRKCWKKVIEGRVYYLAKGRCKGKTDQDGYRMALAECRALKQQIAATKPDPSWIIGRGINLALSGQDAIVADEDYRAYQSSRKPPSETRIDEVVASYLNSRRTAVNAGALSVAQFQEDKTQLEAFLEFVKDMFSANSTFDLIDDRFLTFYSQTKRREYAEHKRHGPITAKKRLQVVKKFLKWCSKSGFELPHLRCLEGYATVSVPHPTITFYTTEEIRRLYDKATRRTKLYILLALNSGATQVDIGTLEPQMIDWEKGLLSRPRHKTGKLTQFRLWPLTIDLLRSEKSTDLRFLLVNENGSPLLAETLNEKGTRTRNDAIKNCFYRLQETTGLINDGRSFKTLRKTSANLIEKTFPEYPHLSFQFLGNGEHSVKRHYVERHWTLMHEATDRLLEIYSLD